MNTFELKPGDKIGVFFYDDWRGSKAILTEVEHISSTGTVTVKTGVRYNYQGREVNALGEATYLCSVERAQEIIEKAATTSPEKRILDISSPEGKRQKARIAAAKAAIRTLNQYGFLMQKNSDIKEMQSEIEEIIEKYL
jgi:hypothetical protein